MRRGMARAPCPPPMVSARESSSGVARVGESDDLVGPGEEPGGDESFDGGAGPLGGDAGEPGELGEPVGGRPAVVEGAPPGDHLVAGEPGAEVGDAEGASSAGPPGGHDLADRDEDESPRDRLRSDRLGAHGQRHGPRAFGPHAAGPIPRRQGEGARPDDARRAGLIPGAARTPIVEARGTVLTGWEGGLRIGVVTARSQVHDPRRRRQTPSRVPSTRQGRSRGHRTRAPSRDGGGFFRWWNFSPSPTSSLPPIRRASGVALVASCAVGAYRCRRGPSGPRDHDGAPRGGRASRDRAFPGRFRWSQSLQSRPAARDNSAIFDRQARPEPGAAQDEGRGARRKGRLV